MAKRKLRWGMTPWDHHPKTRLLREVQRMYIALVAAESALALCENANPGPVEFWHNPQGTGGIAREKVRQALHVHEKYSSGEIHGAFTRYAADLLFEPNGFRIGAGWGVCPKCGRMFGGNDARPAVGRICREVLRWGDCDGTLRPLEWADMMPKEAMSG